MNQHLKLHHIAKSSKNFNEINESETFFVILHRKKESCLYSSRF